MKGLLNNTGEAVLAAKPNSPDDVISALSFMPLPSVCGVNAMRQKDEET
jgi:hypothetical protein